MTWFGPRKIAEDYAIALDEISGCYYASDGHQCTVKHEYYAYDGVSSYTKVYLCVRDDSLFIPVNCVLCGKWIFNRFHWTADVSMQCIDCSNKPKKCRFAQCINTVPTAGSLCGIHTQVTPANVRVKKCRDDKCINIIEGIWCELHKHRRLCQNTKCINTADCFDGLCNLHYREKCAKLDMCDVPTVIFDDIIARDIECYICGLERGIVYPIDNDTIEQFGNLCSLCYAGCNSCIICNNVISEDYPICLTVAAVTYDLGIVIELQYDETMEYKPLYTSEDICNSDCYAFIDAFSKYPRVFSMIERYSDLKLHKKLLEYTTHGAIIHLGCLNTISGMRIEFKLDSNISDEGAFYRSLR